ncbi:potassium-transporting ATPase subunit C [Mycobacteroides abscessus subsp. abscessus]|uniref:ATPase n=1 Tax=Mycobacteroides immunogenum TaxID=83262 RepID=A0A179VHJ5_9MYCO|nr:MULTISPECIES: hypothetical protein [Mycobacteriaceae]OAT69746.1 hypothetical protein AWB85_19570 [Mycobacteroides immunogenum]SHV77168.1 potassium-transporting ATPase subunit C [Mycobacteroides abscessus subsp. bolletii]SII91991.1 potassium-transporting ATPase subunit C [Mycobacteroides abscessus subsp. abscessus]SIK06793.1 potassium-transporting ATPase subunit C [Mycobacteroides abscessus subsp. abscessus]SIK10663.1 potassium-transporting ATPase subunit C [Mycobacteroides abscessus subsp. 
MSTAADKIKANAERIRKAPKPAAPATAAVDETPSAPAAVVRQKNVRRTVDLTPTQHRALDVWQGDTAERLGLARVTGQEVFSALVDRLLADKALAEAITQALSERT